MKGYGDATLHSSYGGFARCDVIVTPAPGNKVDVKVELLNPPDPQDPQPSTTDNLAVGRLALFDDNGQRCVRQILLHDGFRIDVTADQKDGTGANRCGMAQTAADVVVAVLQRDGIPRRKYPFSTSSLARLDACLLPGAAALATVPGLDVPRANPGFARWECTWSGNAGYEAMVRFDRSTPEGGQATRIAGRAAQVDPGYSPDGCAVHIPHRKHFDNDGGQEYETVTVEVRRRGVPGKKLCGRATDLATAVTAR